MKNHLFFLLLFTFIFSFPAFSQKDKLELKVKFGKISEEEIKMTAYAKDPEAAAVVLFDKGYLSYDINDATGFTSSFERHVRIKFFKKSAFDLANFRILYRSNGIPLQRVGDIKGLIYNIVDGKVVEKKLSEENIADENLIKTINVKKVAMPGVQEGSIIELRYKINTEGVSTIKDWEFQDEIPVMWSEYEAEIPEFFDYLPITQGNTPYLVQSKDNGNKSKAMTFSVETDHRTNQNVRGSARANWKTTIYRWVQKDVPAFKIERYMTSANDYNTKVLFQLKGFYFATLRQTITTGSNQTTADLTAGEYYPITNSWSKLGEELMESDGFGDVVDKKSATKDELVKAIS